MGPCNGVSKEDVLMAVLIPDESHLIKSSISHVPKFGLKVRGLLLRRVEMSSFPFLGRDPPMKLP